MYVEDNSLLFLYINLDDVIPEVKASVRIKEDMSLEITFRKALVKTKHVSHLLDGTNRISAVTQVCNVLAAVKSWVTDQGSMIYFSYFTICTNNNDVSTYTMLY